MAIIIREPANASKQEYDLIIVGGGIYGIMLSIEASLRGLHSLLLERGDFGEHTSFNSLRIIHGGLRYLQNLDLHRFRESVGERRWFLQSFPNLVKPLPCLMPLYGDGLRRAPVFRLALWVNNMLSRDRNRGVRQDRHLPSGRVIDADETIAIFPFADRQGLRGGAIWYDACVLSTERLLIEVLRWANELGATALNYVEALELIKDNENVAGVKAVDRESGDLYKYRASVVVNAAGPWCRELAARFHQDEPVLFKPSLAWTILFNRQAISDHAIAVAPKKKQGERVYFLCPWRGKLFAGTGQAPRYGSEEKPMPTTEELQEFLNDLNLAVPSLKVDQNDILHIFAGLLPVTQVGSEKLTTREVIFDHDTHGGPKGFYTISGVKFTTARLVAEKALNRIYFPKNVIDPANNKSFKPPRHVQGGHEIFNFDWYLTAEESEWKDGLQSLITEESVQHLDDLIFRRTSLWDNPSRAMEIAPLICELFDWDDSRRCNEIERLTHSLENGCFIKTSEYRKES